MYRQREVGKCTCQNNKILVRDDSNDFKKKTSVSAMIVAHGSMLFARN